MAPRLHITLLGRSSVALDGQPLDELTLVKARALLIYLAVTNRAHSRQKLAGLLWSDVLESSARASLRVTLMRLREAVGDYVMSDRQTIAVDPSFPLWVDVREFAHACSRLPTDPTSVSVREWDQLRQAIHLYQGDFLHDFNVPGAPLFEEWVSHQREYYRRLALEGLFRLAKGSLDAGRHAAAVEDARTLLRLEPVHEATHRLLMRQYAQSGQTAQALRQYETCARLLQDELGVSPSPETLHLRDAIVRGESATGADGRALRGQQRDAAPVRSASAARQEHASLAARAMLRQSTSFVGRQQEVAQVQAQLANPAVRLLTIVGLGGIGKTRLAIEVAVRTEDQFPHGVWFVPVAPLERAALLPSTIANVLSLPEYGGTDPEGHLLRHLAGRQLLLVLDNFEHLLEASDLISRILAAAPQVKILVTSRVRLQIQEEWLLPLGGLDIPDGDDGVELDPALHSAIELFVQRARQLQPDFTDRRPNVAQIVRICRLVGGMPLGIELAASWLRSIPLEEIAAELQSGLDLLASSMRNVPGAHRSMRAVFDRSWQLLDTQEQQALARLGVFRGGFTRAAARQVADTTTQILARLVDGSWLQLDGNGRYDLHELVRQYAVERLRSLPGEPNRSHQAHAAYFGAMAERESADLGGRQQKAALDRIMAEIDNLRAGWQWAVAHLDVPLIAPYAECLKWLADARSLYLEMLPEFEQAAAKLRRAMDDALLPVLRQQILYMLALLLHHQAFMCTRAVSVKEGLPLAVESLSIFRRNDLALLDELRRRGYMNALAWTIFVARMASEIERATRWCNELLRLATAEPHYRGYREMALLCLGYLAHDQGRYAEAERLYKESMLLSDSQFDALLAQNPLTRLANLYLDIGDLARAQDAIEACECAVEEFSYNSATKDILMIRAELAMAQGQFDRAKRYLDQLEHVV